MWARLGVRMREAACEARMSEPNMVVGVTLGAGVGGRTAIQPIFSEENSNNATKGDTDLCVVGERLSWRASAKRAWMT